MLKKPPRVAILIETSTSWGRGIIWGIGRYVRQNGPWDLHLEPSGYEERLSVPSGWVGEGIIARCRDEELAGQIRAMKIPAVNVSLVHLPGVKMPRVITDEREIAQSALTHLLERGIKHFAFCGPSDRVYVRHRGCVFQQIVADAGFECELYPPPNVATVRSGWLERRTDLAEVKLNVEARDQDFALPDIAVITCCMAEHLEFLGDLMGVRRENASIIEGLGPQGTLVVNGEEVQVDLSTRAGRLPFRRLGP